MVYMYHSLLIHSSTDVAGIIIFSLKMILDKVDIK